MEWIQWSYLRVCLLQLYAYEYKCVTDLGPISLTGLLAPFAVHVHCHMIAYVSNVTVIDNVCCIQKDLRHQLLYYCWRPPRRPDDIRNMFFFISCDIEYSFSVTHVYLLFGVIYAMTCMYIYGNKTFWNWNWKKKFFEIEPVSKKQFYIKSWTLIHLKSLPHHPIGKFITML